MASQSSPTMKARTEGFVFVNRVVISVPPYPKEKPSELNKYSLAPRLKIVRESDSLAQ